MKIAPVADVKARLSGYLERVAREGPIVITRNGKPVALLLAPRDEEDLEQLILAHSPRFQAMLARSRGSIHAGRGLSQDAFWSAVSPRKKKERKRRKELPRLSADIGKRWRSPRTSVEVLSKDRR